MAKHPSVHAKVNIACDKDAEAGHIIFHGKQSKNSIFPNEVGAVLEVGGQLICRRMKEKIHHAAHAPEMLGYLENSNGGNSTYNRLGSTQERHVKFTSGTQIFGKQNAL